MFFEEVFEEVLKKKSKGTSGVLVTVVDREGDGPAAIGAKMLVDGTLRTAGTVGGGALELLAIKEAQQAQENKRSYSKKFNLSDQEVILGEVKTGMICGGKVTLFFEYIGGGTPIYIFGGGHIGKAISEHMFKIDYFVTILDNRDEIMEEIKFANQKIKIDYLNVLNNLDIKDEDYVIIATPSHTNDYTVLKALYSSNIRPKYIGMLGSKKKVSTFLNRLKAEVGNLIDFKNLYTPAGLDIGGATPDEIAISIIAEIQAIRYKKEGQRHMKMDFNKPEYKDLY